MSPLRQFEHPLTIDFMEVAPENWINVGGALGRKFRAGKLRAGHRPSRLAFWRILGRDQTIGGTP